MHVEDSAVPCASTHGHSNLYKIHVYNETGERKTIETSGDVLVCKLRVSLIKSLYPDMKIGTIYKIVSVSKRKILAEGLTLFEEEICDNDVLLLLPCLSMSTSSTSFPSSSAAVNSNCLQASELNLKGPTEIEIWSATANLQAKNLTKIASDSSITLDFHKELRKILVGLIDFTANLLKDNSEVSAILAGVGSDDDENASDTSPEGRVDETALGQLVDMGFSAEKARRALILNNMSPVEAMDWLLAYESTQAPPLPSSSATTSGVRLSGSNNTTAHTSSVSSPFSSRPGTSGLAKSPVELHPEWIAYYDKVPAIVESFKIFKRKSFRPNLKALNNLKKMSFNESLVLDALWIHANNEVAACEWLLSDRRPVKDDLRRGLSVKSPIYRAIINDPTIQLGLLKPRIFFALLQLLEEPNSMSRLLNDSEISSVLSQIFRLYNSEKHSAVTDASRSNSPLMQSSSLQTASLTDTSTGHATATRAFETRSNAHLNESHDPVG